MQQVSAVRTEETAVVQKSRRLLPSLRKLTTVRSASSFRML